MRVLQVLPDLRPSFGGPVNSARGVSAALKKLGHSVHTAGPGDGKVPGGSFVFRPFNVFPRFPPTLISPGLVLWSYRRVRRYDLIHLHLNRSITMLLVAMIVRFLRVPYVVQSHGMCCPWGGWKSYIDRFFTSHIIASAQAVIVLNDSERDELECWTPRRRIWPVINSVDLPLATTRGGPPTPPRFMFSARLHRRKGLDVYVRAAASMVDTKASFVVAGADEGALQPAKDLAERLGVDIEFLGGLRHDDVMFELSASTALVHPAEDEPFGMSLIESLWVGTPVIAAGSSHLASRLKETVAVHLVDRGDVGGYRAAMEELAADSERVWRTKSADAQRWVRANFSTTALSERLQEIYRNVDVRRTSQESVER